MYVRNTYIVWTLYIQKLVLIVDVLGFEHGELEEFARIEIVLIEGKSSDLMIIISCVIQYAIFKVIAGSVESVLIFVVAEIATAILLVDRVEDVEEENGPW